MSTTGEHGQGGEDLLSLQRSRSGQEGASKRVELGEIEMVRRELDEERGGGGVQAVDRALSELRHSVEGTSGQLRVL